MQRIIGHRGASAYAPENTLAAFAKAHALGCRFVEFDVMLSADGIPFIFHDEQLSRTTNGQGEFGLVTADYLQSLDAGLWFSEQFRGEKIPTLQEMIQWLIDSDMQANIEIKPYPGRAEDTTNAVIADIRRYWPKNKELPLISSFDLGALSLCSTLAPELPLGLLLDKWRDDCLQLAHELHCFSVNLSKRAATESRVRSIKQSGYSVYVYTVNRTWVANKLFRWGVDAIFSDYPDLISERTAVCSTRASS